METQPPGSLNLEYFLLRGQDFFAGLQVGTWPHWAIVVVEDILILGMVLSLLFIIFIVYALIRLHQVEHEGFHKLEAHLHERHEAEVESTGKNERWENILKLAYGTNEGDWRRAILEADIMLYDVLEEQGYPGATVGDKLKMANPIQMTTLDLAWQAHKVRNDIAHGGEATPLDERTTRATIDSYKRVFEEFGAI
ncbi:MAG: hypothetical protein V4474_02085 [Patescibacteria group bacterium]